MFKMFDMTKEKLIKTAFILAVVTIVYNVAEGLVSVIFGISDETLALLGFGVDSFVEVLSGTGILHMIFRMRKAGINDVTSRDKFERQALKITGTAFYILVAGLLTGSALNIIWGTKPETTIVGIIISVISILTMYILMTWKFRIGKKLNSDAIIADANCTKTCFYLSFILLVSSGLYELFGIGWLDIAGALGIAWFAFSEGKESFEKAKSEKLNC
jgi:divalent metal cation (Fe/Co/Zn/Cd) transporter